MENDDDNTATSRTASPAANNDNTATTSRTARPAANNDNTATTSRTASSAAYNDNTATTSRTTYNGYPYACAVCRYQRKKCTADCILAPYFPQSRHQQFNNALRLFGVSRMIRVIKDMEPQIRDIAMSTIKYESDARAADPVGGLYRTIQDLEYQIERHEQELSVILQQLAFYRGLSSQQMMPQPQQNHPGSQDEIPLAPLTLQDDKKEEQEEEEEDENDDQKHVLDLNKP